MVALAPLGSDEYTMLVPLEKVAGVERAIPAEWLQEGPIPVSQNCAHYLSPIVGELPQYSAELPLSSLAEMGAS